MPHGGDFKIALGNYFHSITMEEKYYQGNVFLFYFTSWNCRQSSMMQNSLTSIFLAIQFLTCESKYGFFLLVFHISMLCRYKPEVWKISPLQCLKGKWRLFGGKILQVFFHPLQSNGGTFLNKAHLPWSKRYKTTHTYMRNTWAVVLYMSLHVKYSHSLFSLPGLCYTALLTTSVTHHLALTQVHIKSIAVKQVCFF